MLYLRIERKPGNRHEGVRQAGIMGFILSALLSQVLFWRSGNHGSERLSQPEIGREKTMRLFSLPRTPETKAGGRRLLPKTNGTTMPPCTVEGTGAQGTLLGWDFRPDPSLSLNLH